MKKHLVLLLGLAVTLMMASCTKDRYYVKYEVTATSIHIGNMQVDVNTGTGIQSFKTSSKLYSETFGPVSKGFNASVSATSNYGALLYTSIYVSKGEEPFVLKATGGPTAEYVIDF